MAGTGSGRFLYELPAWLVCGLCRLMDALGRADWERFASRIARDQVELRLCDRTDGRTQRLLWAWTNRNARVGELLALLDELELYRARDLLASWQPPSEPPILRPPFLPSAPPAPHPPTGDSRASTIACDPPKPPPQPLPEPSCPSLPLPGPPPSSLLSTSSQGPAPPPAAPPADQALGPAPQALGPAPQPFAWPLAELVQATGGFAERHKVGEGGFGCVYRARLRNTDYAVKRLKEPRPARQGATILRAPHSRWGPPRILYSAPSPSPCPLGVGGWFRHPNIVEFGGFCAERDHFCLVYVFMPNGSLEDRLSGQVPPRCLPPPPCPPPPPRCLPCPLPPGACPPKPAPSNILLDGALHPRLGDFGLARAGRGRAGSGGLSASLGRTHTVRGTLAYLPPEYVQSGALSPSIDTYSYGVKDLVAEEEEVEGDEGPGRSQLVVTGPGPDQDARATRVGTRIFRNHVDSRVGPCPEALGAVYEDLERLQKSLPWDPPATPWGDSLPGAPGLPPNQPVESDESLSEEGGSWLGVAPSLHPPIHINPVRQRIMERLVLYQQGALDSLGVLASELPAGSAPRLPEESDDFEP
ncbi:S-adenosylmethionine decarboxylase proenzyme [Platysternon megacephalum]|uniref:S-adenosylmethionine decarboxylase proenzyme n=1 Tax=Platysternon megacephalum TaxID=55544 RepID=A0A4D9DP34_9SAUR|nr:S-adenosylmethionine decarboxylase proenzyme [Platysternon megacephalum]